MSRLFIRVVNGQPFEHPIVESNFRAAFPDIDVDNLPEGYAYFTRVAKPETDVYEVYEGVSYQLNGGSYTDVHAVRTMTDTEKEQKQNAVKADWSSSGMAENGFSTWVFDDETCSYIAPVPMPDDGNSYVWNDETVSWDLS